MTQPELSTRQAKLEAWIKTKFPQAKDISIASLQKTSSGFSNETYLFTARWTEKGKAREEKFAVRWLPQTYRQYTDYDLSLQFRIMKCLEGSGIPVPKMYWFESDETVLGSPFYVMGAIDGQSPPDAPPSYHGKGMLFDASPQRRALLWNKSIEVLAKIHNLDWNKLGFSFLGVPKGGTDALDRQIAMREGMLERAEGGKPLAVLRAGLEWVKKNRFEPSRISLCWGDARQGNLMYRGDEVVGVVDWEIAYLGDPIGDLAWFVVLDQITPLQHGVPHLDGLPGTDETIRYYETLTGRKVEHFFYHEVFATLKSAIGMAQFCKTLSDSGMAANYPPDFVTNNVPTRKLKELLNIK